MPNREREGDVAYLRWSNSLGSDRGCNLACCPTCWLSDDSVALLLSREAALQIEDEDADRKSKLLSWVCGLDGVVNQLKCGGGRWSRR